jgi:hypothetical protein
MAEKETQAAAAPPSWLADLLAILEAILTVIQTVHPVAAAAISEQVGALKVKAGLAK